MFPQQKKLAQNYFLCSTMLWSCFSLKGNFDRVDEMHPRRIFNYEFEPRATEAFDWMWVTINFKNHFFAYFFSFHEKVPEMITKKYIINKMWASCVLWGFNQHQTSSPHNPIMSVRKSGVWGCLCELIIFVKNHPTDPLECASLW